jgi:long-chain acyl-CoA synthetase
MGAETSSQSAVEFWEERYRAKDQVWSGRVNAPLADEAARLTPGSALDLGCGEGGDALWLAEHGWQVTAVDVSAVAMARGAAQAEGQGLSAHVTWEQHDLANSFPVGEFDLVSAQYFHSPIELPRDTILRRAAQAVRPGGTILVVGHAAPPPWAESPDPKWRFPTTADVEAAIGIDEGGWSVERSETVERRATGPDGQTGPMLDSIVVARRDALAG